MSENITKLKEWHKLYEQKIITEQEFNDKKRELLGLGNSSLPIIEIEKENTSIETNQLEFSRKVDRNNNDSSTDGNYSARSIKKASAINRNTIFFITLAILVIAVFSFWFWNKSKTNNEDLSTLQTSDSIETLTNEENLLKAADSAVEVTVVEQDREANDEELNSSEDIKFEEFFKQFKEAVNTKNKKKALELTNTEEFYTGGVETASEWLEWHFNESASNDERYPYILDELKKGVKKETLKFPDGQKYKIINGDGGGLYFTLKDGKWKFNGVIH